MLEIAAILDGEKVDQSNYSNLICPIPSEISGAISTVDIRL